jgi:hypothetical protein
MIHWGWLIVVAMLGCFGGLLVSAMCVIASGESIEDQIDRETCCGNCKAGCTD